MIEQFRRDRDVARLLWIDETSIEDRIKVDKDNRRWIQKVARRSREIASVSGVLYFSRGEVERRLVRLGTTAGRDDDLWLLSARIHDAWKIAPDWTVDVEGMTLTDHVIYTHMIPVFEKAISGKDNGWQRKTAP